MSSSAVSGYESISFLRRAAVEHAERGQYDEAIRGYLIAADQADALGMRIEGLMLRTNARKVLVLAWARTRWSSTTLDDVVAVHSPSDRLRLGPTRRFRVRSAGLDVLIDTHDCIRIAPRRRPR